VKSANTIIEVTSAPTVLFIHYDGCDLIRLRLAMCFWYCLALLMPGNLFSFSSSMDNFVPATLNKAQLRTPNKLRKLDSAYHALIVVTGTKSRNRTVCCVHSQTAPLTSTDVVAWIWFVQCLVGPCHHGMARPRVADGGTASEYGG
jgi:hypothetical protein